MIFDVISSQVAFNKKTTIAVVVLRISYINNKKQRILIECCL